MADRLSKGARVRWRAGRGSATGTVERVITGRAKVSSRTVAGSKDDPRYVVKNSETGKTTVLKRDSLTKLGGRAAKPKAAAKAKARPKPKAKAKAKARAKRPARSAAAARIPEAQAPAPVTPLPPPGPSPMRRWAAPAALLAVVAAVVGIVVFAGGDDDDGNDNATVATTSTSDTTSTPAEAEGLSEASVAVIVSLKGRPFAMHGLKTIPVQRLGDEQERLKPQFDQTYRSTFAGLAAVKQAATENGADEVAALATYLTQEVKIDQAITDAFVANSFADGDPSSVLADKAAATEAALRQQIDAAAKLTAPPEAQEVRDAFAKARQVNLDYLLAVGAAIGAGDQAALDQALSDGRAAARRAAERFGEVSNSLENETEKSVGTG